MVNSIPHLYHLIHDFPDGHIGPWLPAKVEAKRGGDCLLIVGLATPPPGTATMADLPAAIAM